MFEIIEPDPVADPVANPEPQGAWASILDPFLQGYNKNGK